MRLEEAMHIEVLLKKYAGKKSKSEVLLNLGSSTGEFRKVLQPHIDLHVFAPLDKKIYNIIHFDLKDENGVDLSGNIFDLDTQTKLKKTSPTIVMCCNLLEHLEEKSRNEIKKIFDALLTKNGLILLTVPYSYPLHWDPIDTYFRPTPRELSTLFPNYEVLDETVVISASYLDEFLSYSSYSKIRSLVRLLFPMYKFKEWIALVHRMTWLLRPYKVSCVMLKKI